MNNIDKSFETLVINISLYYQQEYQFIISKLDTCLSIIKEFIYNPISRRTDIYNLTFVIEEIKYSTNYILSDKTAYLSETITLILENISNTNNYEEIKSYLKSLKSLIEKYKVTLGKDFSEKIEVIKTKNLSDLVAKLFNKLTEKDLITLDKDELAQIYTRTINSPKQVIIDQYTEFFNRLKTFLERLYAIDNFIPLKENPILSLLKLAYLIKNGSCKKNRLCNSDILLLKAFYSSKKDIKKLDIINIQIEKDSNIETLYNTPSKVFQSLIEFVELQIFRVSKFFSDFCINDIFFPPQHQQIDISNPESLEQLINCLKDLPNILFDEHTLYKKINTKDEPYKKFFINNSDKRPLEVIIENSPATLLTKIANKYFQMLLEVATIINIQLSKNDLELLSPFLDFEKYFNQLATQISRNSELDLQILNKEISNIVKTSYSLIEAYNTLKTKELDIINNQNFINSVDVDKLNFFINTQEFLNFKQIKITTTMNHIDINIDKVLTKINKSIANAKFQNASLTAKDLTMQLLCKIYYSCPKLIGVYNLPPVSHNLYLAIKEVTNRPALDNIKNKQEIYWRV
ncbi:hypothetical protein [Francisella opportunistica]|uniref:hypothetical protein n=1 Tax=Francisella opportunistica TaxID=2016517 RepID=UPI000E0CAFF8|nr:hypothetical protein [Francisella opportunistica]AXH32809.1 DNA polymerase I [Francisella opportunistica]